MDMQSPRYKQLLNKTALTLEKWARQAHERRLLAQLDYRELSDMGISPCDRLTELSKPFWRD
ncbi:DUF1127 domain-containing protein [Pseudomonas syringae]|uniref:DUF1127 domain-containing protein n=1 Tax=Pseudomonas syringae TaxID=317 RepID=UPI000F02CE1A|nr:DUF1127 domain-containing protein [Pseudomonas syringae]MCF5720863.1 DUF1127 domain-containing protein [Pseudomonas syringae]